MYIYKNILFYLYAFLAFSFCGIGDEIIKNARQLTFEGARSGEGYCSPNGKKLVYQSESHKKNPFYQIYLLDLLSGENKLVSSGIGKTTCAWIHPDERTVLYSSTHLDANASLKEIEELKGEERVSDIWVLMEKFDLLWKAIIRNQVCVKSCLYT